VLTPDRGSGALSDADQIVKWILLRRPLTAEVLVDEAANQRNMGTVYTIGLCLGRQGWLL